MTISLIGDGVMFVALAWQVLTLSNAPSALALVGLAITLPQVVLALLGGVVSDRFDRRVVMIAADVVRAGVLVVVGALSITGELRIWHLLVLGACYGAGSAFFAPAFDAIIPGLVPADVLTEANSLDQLVRPLGTRLIGPLVGGLVVAAAGAGWAFVADAGTFVFSVACLMRVSTSWTPSGAGTSSTSAAADLRECFQFVRARVWLWGTLLSSSVACLLFLGPSEVLLPFVVKHDLHASASTLGAVLAAGGIGAVGAAVVVGSRGLPRRSITLMYTAWTVSTIGIAAYGIARFTWQLMLACLLFNALETAGLIVWATVRQRNVPRELLGRVASLDWFVATGLTPLSFALVGPAAAVFGVRGTLVGAGLLASAVTAAAFFLPGMRSPEGAPAATMYDVTCV